MAPPKVYKKIGENRYYLPISVEPLGQYFYLDGISIDIRADGSLLVWSGGIHSKKLKAAVVPDALETIVAEISEAIINLKDEGKTDSEVAEQIRLNYTNLRF